MYLNPTIIFKFLVFHNFNFLVEVKHEGIMMKWITNPNTRTNHFALDCLKQHIYVKHKIMVSKNVSWVMKHVLHMWLLMWSTNVAMLQWPLGWIGSKVSSSNCDSCLGDSLFSILTSRRC
jgi:hypothetical protein